jgi:2-polyprenyl-3-methyl-5-hydroxy-6-metoxy-1,4-benzoquinol methylase
MPRHSYRSSLDVWELGLMSQHLIGSVKSILGIDISEKMIEAYNQKMERLDEAKGKATAVQMNIMQEYDLAYAGRKFDVIVVSKPHQDRDFHQRS